VSAPARRSDAPWDLSFLRVGALVAGAVALVAAPVTGFVAGWTEAVGVVIGAAIVTAFFCVSGVVVAWAGRIADSYTLPAALITFFIKAGILYAILIRLPDDGWLDRRTIAWAVVVGALLWSGVQLRWVWTRKLFYVPPPAPPNPDGGPRDPSSTDPRSPATRG